MPPKKVEEPERKPLIGRVGTNLRVGIVGVPNVGKSTFFNVLTKSAVAAENFPFCTINPNENKRDYYVREKPNRPMYKPCQTALLDINFMKYITNCTPCKSNEEEIKETGIPFEYYPAVNSYYVYTEDMNPEFRINRYFYSSDESFASSYVSKPNSSLLLQENMTIKEAYSEFDTQLKYLLSTPVSFFIFGKPDIGQTDVGQLLAEYWKSIFIDPYILIAEEVNSGSRAGKCIEYNLRCGRAIGKDIIMRLFEKRMKCESVIHRGAVICGFPLIETLYYEKDPVSSESAVFNVTDIFDEVIDATVIIGIPPQVPSETSLTKRPKEQSKGSDEDEDEDEEKESAGKSDEEEEQIEEETEDVENASIGTKEMKANNTVTIDPPHDVGHSSFPIVSKDGDGIEISFMEQVDRLFKFVDKNSILIYIKCENEDVINIHDQFLFDLTTKREVNEYHLPEKHVFTVFHTHEHHHQETPKVNESIQYFYDEINTTVAGSPKHTYLFKLPRNSKINVDRQLHSFRHHVQPLLETYFVRHNQQYLIKVDGRANPLKIYSDIRMKLKTLPLQRVLIPEKLSVLEQKELMGEGDVSAINEINFEGKTVGSCFEVLRNKQVASSMFKWQWSDWGPKCPVSMKEGEYVNGDPNFAVRFMNKIFFLNNEDAYWKFYRNPRPYLIPPYPRSRCRIFVMGPDHSGKSVLSRCLASIMKAQVLDPKKLVKQYFTDKGEKFREKIRSTAIAEALIILEKQLLEERFKKIEKWKQDVTKMYEEFIELDKVYSDEVKAMQQDPLSLEAFSSFAVKMKRSSEEGISSDEVRYNVLLEKLKKKGFPTKENEIKSLLKSEEELQAFYPRHLRASCEIVVDVFHPFVREYVEQALAESNVGNKLHEMTNENTVEMFEEAISNVEEMNRQQDNLKGGWIIDGMSMDTELFQNIGPTFIADDIIYLDDSETNFEYLLNRFRNSGSDAASINFVNILHEANFSESRYLYSLLHEPEMIVEKIVQEMIDNTVPIEESENEEELLKLKCDAYEQHLHTSNDNWIEVKNYLYSINKTPFSINISEKNISEVVQNAVSTLLDQFRQTASVFTSEDRADELKDFSPMKSSVFDEEGEEGGEEEQEEMHDVGVDLFFDNRRFGETFNYCPVTFRKSFILCKGKEELAVKFMNKLYFLHNEKCMKEFLQYPRKFLNLQKPETIFPPPRIFIVGRRKSGKTKLSKLLARNLGLYYVNFDKVILNALQISGNNLNEATSANDTILNYLEGSEPLPEYLMKTFMEKIFFTEPIRNTGFVIDGFPKRPTDVEFMEINGTVPDIVLELSVDDNIRIERLVECELEDWKTNNDNAERNNNILLETWELESAKRLRELLENAKSERYAAKMAAKAIAKETEGEESEGGWDTKSQVSYDSVQEEQDLIQVEALLERELPPPILEDISETEELARQRIYQNVLSIADRDLQFLSTLREFCDSELIKWTIIDANLPLEKTILLCIRECEGIKFRNISLFERCYDISYEIAEKLIESGYFFLSKFGYTCPVQVYDKHRFIQMYIPAMQKDELFPIINKNHIYFVVGKQSRDKFKKNPLKYTTNKCFDFPLVPATIAIIGPPKCGKTSLAERFRNEWGLKIISRGAACRYVQKYLHCSALNKEIEVLLRHGHSLIDDAVIRAVDALCMDGRAITQGYVFDGFPNTENEMKCLSDIGRVPQLILYLNTSQNVVHEFRKGENQRKGMPLYTETFINHRYDEWHRKFQRFRPWVEATYQNLVEISVSACKWGIWSAVLEVADRFRADLSFYYKYALKGIPVPLEFMCVTEDEFYNRIGEFYRQYCPGCLNSKDIMTAASEPPDRAGLVQYFQNFYWLCRNHLEEFIDNPLLFFPPNVKKKLPFELPQRWVGPIGDVKECFHEGMCVICYFKSDLQRLVIKGHPEFAVKLGDNIYLFDSEECLQRFMQQSHLFSNRTVHVNSGNTYPSLDYMELPTLGMLEQMTADILVKAITNTGILRPVIPGLDIATSAIINIGLYLKGRNPKTTEEERKLYREAKDKLMKRLKKFQKNLKHLKNHVNPYVYYEERLTKPILTAASIRDDHSIRSSPFPRPLFSPLSSRNAHLMEVFDHSKTNLK